MRREHQPSYTRWAHAGLSAAYARHFVHPHFDAIGGGTRFVNPWHVQVLGGPVSLGAHVHVSATRSKPVEFAVWSDGGKPAHIDIGDYAMINPGLRIMAARAIEIGRNALFAPNVSITDADWHDRYNRSASLGQIAPVTLEDNVWVGEGALICKGVRIGSNSIVGARAIVTKDVPPNTIVAGNPARIVDELRPDGPFLSRSDLMRDPDAFYREARREERGLLRDNSLASYIRYLLFPRRDD